MSLWWKRTRTGLIVVGSTVGIVAVLAVFFYKNSDEFAYTVERLVVLNRLEIAVPVYDSVELVKDSNGYVVFVFRGVHGWTGSVVPVWETCKQLKNGYGIGYVRNNFKFSERFELFVQIRDKAYVAFMRPEKKGESVVMLWEFMDSDGDPPAVKNIDDICEIK